MKTDPGLPQRELASLLASSYGIRAGTTEFLPVGYDLQVSVYRVLASDGSSYFMKVRRGAVNETALQVPRVLTDSGVPNLLAPLPSLSGALWAPMSSHSVVLFPYISGKSASDAGMSDEQWQVFGATMRSLHTCGIEHRFANSLPREDFALPSAGLVRQLLNDTRSASLSSVTARRFAEFWQRQAGRIEAMLQRAEGLGGVLQARRFEHVLCHADIHPANILVAEDGRIYLVDWDGPLVAPRERDLLFVVDGHIARKVLPREEALFFEGYGEVEVDLDALVYYRYERIIEDIGVMGDFILFNAGASDEARDQELDMLTGFFEPGRDIDRAEDVSQPRLKSTRSV